MKLPRLQKLLCQALCLSQYNILWLCQLRPKVVPIKERINLSTEPVNLSGQSIPPFCNHSYQASQGPGPYMFFPDPLIKYMPDYKRKMSTCPDQQLKGYSEGMCGSSSLLPEPHNYPLDRSNLEKDVAGQWVFHQLLSRIFLAH